jgi:hypothetical protein
MDGTVLSVERTLKQFEKYDEADTIEDVKAVNPWIALSKGVLSVGENVLTPDLTGEELQAMGLNSPPYHGRSYSEDTEFYTDKGWVYVTDLTGKELFLSPSSKGMAIEWVRAKKITWYDPKGKMCLFDSQNMALLVTVDHDQIYSRLPWDKTEAWKTAQAENLMGIQKIYIPRCAKWKGKNTEKISIGTQKIDIITFIKFMAYWLSDGSVTKRGENSYFISIANRKRQNIIYGNIKGLPYKLHKRKTRIDFNDTGMGKYLGQFGHAPDKFIPSEIKELSSGLLKIFLEAYLVCDGSIVKTHGKYSSDNSTVKTFFTTSKRMADDIGECILKAGGHPQFTLQNQKGEIVTRFDRSFKCNYDVWRIRWNTSKTATFGKNGKGKISIVPYKGKAYCVELEKNHILWVRRNGKTCFSGNCRSTVAPVL